MIRIREISDPDLRERIRAALAERRGMSAAAIPDWFELDDADFVDLLNDIRAAESGEDIERDDPRM
ncbi:MAG: hypothetical protein H7Z14_17860 [Anaerolineae bacterium]|nr:hypothetical protein [Phycisphaerae bacterium]